MDSTSLKLVDPKLTVYAYHLHQNFTGGRNGNANRLWGWVEEIAKQLNVKDLEEFSKNLNLNSQKEDSGTINSILSGESKSIGFLFEMGANTNKVEVFGEVCPFIIHDCYAIDLTLRLVGEAVSLCSLKHLNPKRMMLPDVVKSSLGQTLVFFAGVTGDTSIDIDKSLATLAKKIASAILDSSEPPPLRGVGKLFGGSIFEFSDQQYPPHHTHLLVWLYSESMPITKESEAKGSYYYPLINLLESRNKIITVWEEVRKCKKELIELRQYLEDSTKEFEKLADSQLEEAEARKDRLNNWEQLLLKLPTKSIRYDQLLGDMFTHNSSVKANIHNYQKALERLKKVAVEGDDLEFDLEFLLQFLEKDCVWFQKQIQLDIDVTAPGRELFYNLIEAMRGMVAIDAEKQKLESSREERKRSIDFKIWLTALGSGLTISSISSRMEPRPSQVMFSNQSQNPNQPQTLVLFNFVDLVIYILIALVFGSIIRVLVRRFYDWKFPDKDNQGN